jgi:hypothetical protein
MSFHHTTYLVEAAGGEQLHEVLQYPGPVALQETVPAMHGSNKRVWEGVWEGDWEGLNRRKRV